MEQLGSLNRTEDLNDTIKVREERSRSQEVKGDRSDMSSEVKDRITKMHLNFDQLHKNLS